MEPEKSLFIKCNCGGCNVLEFNADDEMEQINVSIWFPSTGQSKLSKKERIRWCEHIMKTGNPWADHTIVNQQDAKRIVEFLTEQLNKYSEKTKHRDSNGHA
jgi:hypothetical protein